ncbi:MAG: glycosyltransferase [Desulfocapsaceae bacterium]|nr:glycosyltransferase [Desulfocapsaceae bacterium]
MKIHILSDSPRGTSAYAGMARNLALGLSGCGYEVSITGFQTFFAPEYFENIQVFPLLNPTDPGDPQIDQLKKNLKKSNADALICIYQADSHFNIYSLLKNPTYFWVPVEGEGIPQIMGSDLKAANMHVISQTYAGQKELAQEHIESSVIYPGWNPEIFTEHPEPHCKWSIECHRQAQNQDLLSNRGCRGCKGSMSEDCRHFEEEQIIINHREEEFYGKISDVTMLKDNLGIDFVVGCVATNMGLRKRLERLIESFALFNKDYRDSLLHIHTSLSLHGLPLIDLIKKQNILNNVVLSYGEYPFSISDNAINQFYNYFDINATASGAEGFGKTHLESMAIGKAQVAPNFGSFPELLGENERGLLASVAATHMTENGTTRCLVDTDSLADKMEALCTNPGFRHKLGNAGQEWAKQFTWDKIVQQWDEVLGRTKEHNKYGEIYGILF